MTIQHLFPIAKPTLDLNFAGERSLDPRITFSRSSIGSYVDEDGIIRYAAEDEPRFDHDPVTGESLGLLIEESRTNLMEYSEARAGWAGSDTQINDDTTVMNPAGAMNTLKFDIDSGSTGEIRYNSLAPGVPQDDYGCWSCYIKPDGGWTKFATRSRTDGNIDCYFLLEGDGELVKVQTKDNAFVKYVGNGWYRFGWVGRGHYRPGYRIELWDYRSNGTPSGKDWANVTGSGLYFHVWGQQLENVGTDNYLEDPVSALSSYIPTNGTAGGEDRDPDNCSIEGTNFSSWYNQGEGTTVIKFDYSGAKNDTMGIYVFIEGSVVGTNSNLASRINLRINRSRGNLVKPFARTDVSTVLEGEGGIIDPDTTGQVAFAIRLNDSQVATDGSLGTVTGPDVYPVADRLWLGISYPTDIYINGHIARFSYYPRRLSDEQLKALTS